MKISLEWLSQYLPGPLDASKLAHALTHGGLPVEVIERHGDDTVIDVEVTSNRGDCLSHVGVARELAALLGREFRPPSFEVAESGAQAKDLIGVEIADLSLCPYYGARVIRGVKVAPSPAWMTRRLEAAGVRAINNLVDATNYVMLELGQPLHAFDLRKLGGGKIIVRTARAGETLVSLDGHTRKLATDMLTIADATKAVALAGVMGGLESEVTDATVDVLLEGAQFEPLSVRKTARALAMKSEASYRFERGLDPTLAPLALARCASLIVQTAGGQLLRGIVQAGTAEPARKKLSLRLARVETVLGVRIGVEDAVRALSRLQLSPEPHGDVIECTIPPYRRDLNIEVDLIEEVARIWGYDRIPVRDEIPIRLTAPEPARKAEDRIRTALVGAGYFEAVTFSFCTDGLAEHFAPAGATLAQADPVTRKSDNRLRPSILPGLLEAVARNEAVGTAEARLFEIGSTFWHAADGSIDERRRLGLAGSTDYRAVRGAIEAVLGTLDATKSIKVVPDEAPGYARGSTGRIEWAGNVVGFIGVVDKVVADRLGLRHHPIVAELELPILVAGTQHVPQLRPLPRFPAVDRDLSLVVAESVRYEAIESLINGLAPEMLESVHYVTTYRGKPLENGVKSVTVALRFRSTSSTLTSEIVEGPVNQIIAAAKEKLGATLRA